MATPALTHLPDILEEHLEELQLLWSRRAEALRSPRYTPRHIALFDARIGAHTDGVRAVPNHALPPLQALLLQAEGGGAFTAAMALLALGAPDGGELLADAYAQAGAQMLLSLGDALRVGSMGQCESAVRSRLRDDDPLASVVSRRVLARHTPYRPRSETVVSFVRDASPAVRRQGWRLAQDLSLALDPKSYAAALRDEDHGVRSDALLAAAWCGVLGARAMARYAAEQPTIDNAESLRLLAVLGERDDEKRLAYVITDSALGILRLELAGLYGAPRDVPMLLDAMSGDDPRAAIAAGEAFRRITGVDVESTVRATLPPADGSQPDSFEQEFLDEGNLPDPTRAREHWARVAPSLDGARRLCWGLDSTSPMAPFQLIAADMETRWYQVLRARFYGTLNTSMAELEAYPARF